MTDLDERPSKIRRLNSEPDSNESTNREQKFEAEHKAPTTEGSIESPNQAENDIEDDGDVNAMKIGVEEDIEEQPVLSKSQQKKLRKREEWEAGKESRKAFRKEKLKEKKARKAEARKELQAKIANGEIPAPPLPTPDKSRPVRPIQVPITLILDCDFNDLMMEKELISLGSQMTRCYSDNKCSSYRSHFVVSSWGGSLKTRFETVLSSNHLSWKGVRFLESDFEVAVKEMDEVMRGPEGGKLTGALAPTGDKSSLVSKEDLHLQTTGTESKTPPTSETQPSSQTPSADTILGALTGEESVSIKSDPLPIKIENGNVPPHESIKQEPSEPSVIYLTSDSPNTLDRLQPNTSYIIGGIVDKNRHKGLCYKRAQSRGIPTAKLPIGEYMTMQSRSVLAVNHVVEIMLKWLETGDWGEAFLSVIPKRKEARLKNQRSESESKEEISEDETMSEVKAKLEERKSSMGIDRI
ncbi:hypothetical protein G7Y89_g9174 [Cudoniella acicularis]|uniref:tRNA (guanine(9)-N1)-methyltransferase n=1 Tax=Cudoniella acicularis TaxID=354080 RepID=A0A8H4RIV5_9HELO|nr:hypothetical protein G7Y89_g9174 [Cudoniella acicularis]